MNWARLAVATQQCQEAIEVEVVERRLDLVEDVEGARPREEHGEQERERRHRLLARPRAASGAWSTCPPGVISISTPSGCPLRSCSAPARRLLGLGVLSCGRLDRGCSLAAIRPAGPSADRRAPRARAARPRPAAAGRSRPGRRRRRAPRSCAPPPGRSLRRSPGSGGRCRGSGRAARAAPSPGRRRWLSSSSTCASASAYSSCASGLTGPSCSRRRSSRSTRERRARDRAPARAGLGSGDGLLRRRGAPGSRAARATSAAPASASAAWSRSRCAATSAAVTASPAARRALWISASCAKRTRAARAPSARPPRGRAPSSSSSSPKRSCTARAASAIARPQGARRAAPRSRRRAAGRAAAHLRARPPRRSRCEPLGARGARPRARLRAGLFAPPAGPPRRRCAAARSAIASGAPRSAASAAPRSRGAQRLVGRRPRRFAARSSASAASQAACAASLGLRACARSPPIRPVALVAPRQHALAAALGELADLAPGGEPHATGPRRRRCRRSRPAASSRRSTTQASASSRRASAKRRLGAVEQVEQPLPPGRHRAGDGRRSARRGASLPSRRQAAPRRRRARPDRAATARRRTISTTAGIQAPAERGRERQLVAVADAQLLAQRARAGRLRFSRGRVAAQELVGGRQLGADPSRLAARLLACALGLGGARVPCPPRRRRARRVPALCAPPRRPRAACCAAAARGASSSEPVRARPAAARRRPARLAPRFDLDAARPSSAVPSRVDAAGCCPDSAEAPPGAAGSALPRGVQLGSSALARSIRRLQALGRARCLLAAQPRRSCAERGCVEPARELVVALGSLRRAPRSARPRRSTVCLQRASICSRAARARRRPASACGRARRDAPARESLDSSQRACSIWRSRRSCSSRGFGLALERAQPRASLALDVERAVEVLLRALELELRAAAALAVLAEPGGLLDQQAPLARLGGDDRLDAALGDDRVRLLAETGVREHLDHVAEAAARAVQPVAALAVAIQPPTIEISLSGRSTAPSELSSTISTSAAAARLHAPTAAEDHVLHRLAPDRQRRLLAHRPQHRVGDVRLTRAVGPDDDADTGAEVQSRAVGEGLEALQGERLQAHRGAMPPAARRHRARPPARRASCCVRGRAQLAPADARDHGVGALVRRALLAGDFVVDLLAAPRKQLLQRGLEVDRMLERASSISGANASTTASRRALVAGVQVAGTDHRLDHRREHALGLDQRRRAALHAHRRRGAQALGQLQAFGHRPAGGRPRRPARGSSSACRRRSDLPPAEGRGGSSRPARARCRRGTQGARRSPRAARSRRHA